MYVCMVINMRKRFSTFFLISDKWNLHRDYQDMMGIITKEQKKFSRPINEMISKSFFFYFGRVPFFCPKIYYLLYTCLFYLLLEVNCLEKKNTHTARSPFFVKIVFIVERVKIYYIYLIIW